MPKKLVSLTVIGCRHCGAVQSPNRHPPHARSGFYRQPCEECGVVFVFTQRGENGSREFVSEVPTASEVNARDAKNLIPKYAIEPFRDSPAADAIRQAIPPLERLAEVGRPNFAAYAEVMRTIEKVTRAHGGELLPPCRAFLEAVDAELQPLTAKADNGEENDGGQAWAGQ